MGGNGSYSKLLGAVPIAKRTHTDTNHRVDGHKVLLQPSNKLQLKTPMNSNSESPIYLIGSKNKHTGDIQISTIAIYKNHRISKTIDLIFDKEDLKAELNNDSILRRALLTYGGADSYMLPAGEPVCCFLASTD